MRIVESPFSNEQLNSQKCTNLDRMLNATLPPNNAFKYDTINQLKGNINDIYFIERRIEHTLKKINYINDKNKQLLLKFYDYCRADGLSRVRIERLLRIMLDIYRMVGKNLNKLSKDDLIKLIGDIESKEWSYWTKYTYKVAIKKFYKWLGKEELISWIKTRGLIKRLLPEEILSVEEINLLVESHSDLRFKTMFSVFYESGARPGEFFTLKVKNVCFDDYGAILTVNGKMGMRRIRIVKSSELLKRWIFVHPLRDVSESPLWISSDWKRITSYGYFRKVLRRTMKRCNINKRVYPYLFRHSRATHLANFLTEAQMNIFFGWVQGSRMASTYVHLSGRDIDRAILKLNGIDV